MPLRSTEGLCSIWKCLSHWFKSFWNITKGPYSSTMVLIFTLRFLLTFKTLYWLKRLFWALYISSKFTPMQSNSFFSITLSLFILLWTSSIGGSLNLLPRSVLSKIKKLLDIFSAFYVSLDDRLAAFSGTITWVSFLSDSSTNSFTPLPC